MDAEAAEALGYVGALHVRMPIDGEPVQIIYPLAGWTVEDLRADAIVRFERLWEHGPEPDGWGVWEIPEFDGKVYQLMLREVQLPDLHDL